MNPSHYKVKMLSIKESSVKCLLDQSYLGGSKNAGLLNFQVSENWERGLCSITDRAHVFSPQHASLRPINSNKGWEFTLLPICSFAHSLFALLLKMAYFK